MGKAKKQKKVRGAKTRLVKKPAAIPAGRASGKTPSSLQALPARGMSGGGKSRKEGSGRKATAAVLEKEDAEIAQVAGIPDETQIEEAVGALPSRDQEAFRRVCELLAQHLGSSEAARLWLATPSPGFLATPLDAIRKGQAKLVLATLESMWGPSPTYA